MSDESLQPHAPDVFDRQTRDGGISEGWAFHMQPSVRYWIDTHTHMSEKSVEDVTSAVTNWHDLMWAHRLRRHVALDGDEQRCEAFAAAAKQDDRFLWLCRLPPEKPDADHLRRCKELGAVGLKLHNATLMSGDVDRAVIRSDAWHRVYELAGELSLPIVWHVTQRLSESPYTGGGRDSYWKLGWPKGVTFTNQDLLDDFLSIVAAHPRTHFIGAHQLHMGTRRLSDLFSKHPNLFTDTSVGGFVAYGDVIYEADRRIWRDFVIAHADRILFGTDVMMNRTTVNTELLREHFLGHLRWIKQLQLPQDVLSKIAHENIERLAGLSPVPPLPWGYLRP